MSRLSKVCVYCERVCTKLTQHLNHDKCGAACREQIYLDGKTVAEVNREATVRARNLSSQAAVVSEHELNIFSVGNEAAHLALVKFCQSRGIFIRRSSHKQPNKDLEANAPNIANRDTPDTSASKASKQPSISCKQPNEDVEANADEVANPDTLARKKSKQPRSPHKQPNEDPVANADKVASRATAEMPSRKTSKQPNSSPTQLNDDPEANRDIVANQEKDDTPAGITSNNVLPREDMLEETTFLPAIPLKMFYRGKKCQGGKEAGSPGSECGKTVAIANLDALRKL